MSSNPILRDTDLRIRAEEYRKLVDKQIAYSMSVRYIDNAEDQKYVKIVEEQKKQNSSLND